MLEAFVSIPPADRATASRRFVAARWLVLAAAWLSTGCSPTALPPAPSALPSAGPFTPTPPASLAPTTSATLPAPAWTLTPALPSPTPTPAFSLPAAELPLSEISYRIPLTIRHVTQDTAELFFELEEPAPGAVYLRPNGLGHQPFKSELSPSETRHRVAFGELEPGMDYEVVVALGTDPEPLLQPSFRGRAWGPVNLRTQSGEGTLRFAVIGDASFGDPTTKALIGQMAEADLGFVLHAGDVVDETEIGVDPYDSYAQKFFNVFEPVLQTLPVYTVPGNHDYDLDIRYQGRPFYFHAFPAFADPNFPGQEAAERHQFYGFEISGVRFLMLDSQVLFGAPGRDEQANWLEDRLGETGHRATIVVFHVAPFSSSSVHPRDGLPVQSTWVPLFEKGNVAVVFSGHFHQYERLAVNGIPYIVSGGGSATLYAPGAILPQSQVFKRQSHFVLGEISDDSLRLTAIGLEGQVIDQTTIPFD